MSKRRKRPPTTPPGAVEEVGGVALLLSEAPAASLDLHGYTVARAERRVRDFLTAQARVAPGRVVHVITGKGSRSEGRAALLERVRELLDDELSHLVDAWAGALGGGGWVVRLPGARR